ncbi:MAG: hypothetical protein ACQKBY_01940 [Verrucomicrobiales bacterium]
MNSPKFLCALLLGSLASCSSHKTENPPYEPDLPFRPAKISDHTQAPGYGLYMKSCYQCHQQADPASLTNEKWEMTVPVMAKHAGITEKEGQLVLNYILHVRSEGLR